MDEKLLLVIAGVDPGYDFVPREIQSAVVVLSQIDVLLRGRVGREAPGDSPGSVLDVDPIGAGLRDQTEKISLLFILHGEGWMVRFGNVATYLAQIGSPASSYGAFVRKVYAKCGDSLAID